jgi:GT2 family glycosyltransferase
VKLGVVIVNFNGRAYIADCLESVRRSDYRPSLIIVVDNGSTDDSAELVGRVFPEITVVRNVNSGFAGGVNVGIRRAVAAGCGAVVLVNPDATLEADALGAFVAAIERHPDSLLTPAIAFASAPAVSDSYAGTISWVLGRMTAPFLARDLRELPSTDTEVQTASFCCIAIPKSVWEAIGPLPEEYFLYFEDADYIARARRDGFALWYVPAALVLHRESSATGGRHSPAALYYYVRNRHIFVRRWQKNGAMYLAFMVVSTVDVLARTARFIALGRPALATAVLRGALHGWAGRTGPAPPKVRIAVNPSGV